jgi:hypothetical protein
LELNSKIYTADRRATLLTWGPIVAGLGFMYGFAGMVLFLSALLLIIGTDSLLQAGVRFRREIKPQEKSPPVAHNHTLPTRPLNLAPRPATA